MNGQRSNFTTSTEFESRTNHSDIDNHRTDYAGADSNLDRKNPWAIGRDWGKLS